MSKSVWTDAQARERIGSALFAAFGFVIFAYVLAETLSFAPEAQPFPRVVAIVGMLAAGTAILQSLFASRAPRDADDAQAANDKGPSRGDLLISYLGPPLYAGLLLLSGFWFASAIFLAGLLLVLGERRPVVVVSMTVGSLAVIYAVFEWGFGIRLPTGLLFG